MQTLDIKSPVFRILSHKNVLKLEQVATRLYREENWYPVGGVGKRGNDWIQVVVKENCICDFSNEFFGYKKECPAHGIIVKEKEGQ